MHHPLSESVLVLVGLGAQVELGFVKMTVLIVVKV